MKNLTLVIGILLSGVAYGQNSWTSYEDGTSSNVFVGVAGIDSLYVGGLYSIVSLSRDLIGFSEVINEAKRVLDANGIEWKDQFDTESSIKFKDFGKAADVYFKVIRGDGVQISWLIHADTEKATFAFLFLQSTGFSFKIDPRYL